MVCCPQYLVFHQFSVGQQLLLNDTVEVSGDQDIGAVCALGQPVAERGSQERHPVNLGVVRRGRRYIYRGEGRGGGIRGRSRTDARTHCGSALAKLVKDDEGALRGSL